MELLITIPGELPDLNSYIKALNRNRFVGAEIKKQATDIVYWETRKQVKKGVQFEVGKQLYFIFNWYCKNKKKDPDNVCAGKKWIFDGLQLAKVIPQDTWNVVSGFEDHFFIDSKNPRIEIIIKYKNNEQQ
jgi:hypothetical protein